jgi:hypothetical protein
MVTVFWDSEGVILLDVMQRGTKINSDTYQHIEKNEDALALCTA